MTYLVDANVISEPTKPVLRSNVVDWLSANERNLVAYSPSPKIRPSRLATRPVSLDTSAYFILTNFTSNLWCCTA